MTTPSLTSTKVLCFDVYGTLIDWETGIYTAASKHLFDTLFECVPRDSFLRAYLTLEAAQQRETPKMRYSDLLAAVYARLNSDYGLPPSPDLAAAFGDSIRDWPVFEDSAEALKVLKKHFKLVVLSNVDRASFENSLSKLGGEGTFDLVLTAEDIGSYKPAVENFEYMLREVKERWGVEKDEVCVTAQSLYHDHVPAKKLGLKSAWIDRKGAIMGVGKVMDVSGAGYEWKFATLGEMAEEVERQFEKA